MVTLDAKASGMYLFDSEVAHGASSQSCTAETLHITGREAVIFVGYVVTMAW